jgi:hypothetical protein
MLVTLAVLNKGTDCSELQPLNIPVMLVTLAVLNKGTDCSELQLTKFDSILFIAPISLISILSTTL